MVVKFTLEDMTETLDSWHNQAREDESKLKRILSKTGHDLISPAHPVAGFCNVLKEHKDITENQKEALSQISDVVDKYVCGLKQISSYLGRLEFEKEGFPAIAISPLDGATEYYESLKELDLDVHFLKLMMLRGPLFQEIIDFSPLINSNIRQIIYSANKLFSKTSDAYRIDLDTEFFIKDNEELFDEKKIKIYKDVEPEIFKHDYVGEVVSYLLNNVIDHAFLESKEELHEVRIDGVHDSSMYVLKIRDNGSGIDEELFSDPKDVFGFGNSRRCSNGSHHGEGLYLVENFVKEHGGEITAENNNPQPGATFTVKIPLSYQ